MPAATTAVVHRPPRVRSSGRTSATTIAATMAMFHPEIATTWVSPAVANASLTSGAIAERTPSRMPAPSAASGSGTRSLSPSRRLPRSTAMAAAIPPPEPGRTSAPRARAIAPTPCRARYSRYAKPSKSSASSIRAARRSRSPLRTSTPRGSQTRTRSANARGGSASTRTSPSTSWRRSARGRGSSTTVPTNRCSAPSARLATDAAADMADGSVAACRHAPAAAPTSATPSTSPTTPRPPSTAAMETSAAAATAVPTGAGGGPRSAPRMPAAAPDSSAGRTRRAPATLSRRWRGPGCPRAARG